jgi:hypothetical protein
MMLHVSDREPGMQVMFAVSLYLNFTPIYHVKMHHFIFKQTFQFMSLVCRLTVHGSTKEAQDNCLRDKRRILLLSMCIILTGLNSMATEPDTALGETQVQLHGRHRSKAAYGVR